MTVRGITKLFRGITKLFGMAFLLAGVMMLGGLIAKAAEAEVLTGYLAGLFLWAGYIIWTDLHTNSE